MMMGQVLKCRGLINIGKEAMTTVSLPKHTEAVLLKSSSFLHDLLALSIACGVVEGWCTLLAKPILKAKVSEFTRSKLGGSHENTCSPKDAVEAQQMCKLLRMAHEKNCFYVIHPPQIR